MESRENREQSRCCNWKRRPSPRPNWGRGQSPEPAEVKTGQRKIRFGGKVQEPEYFVAGRSFAPVTVLRRPERQTFFAEKKKNEDRVGGL
jgi:hypothetical protein